MESLSIHLQPFFDSVLRTTLQASLLICLILLLQTILRNRLGVRWHYCLWLLLLVRMAMPWAPESRVSLFNLLPEAMPQRQFEHVDVQVGHKRADSFEAGADTSKPTPIPTTPVAQIQPEARTATPPMSKEAKGPAKSAFPRFAIMLPLAWLAGVLVLAIYVCTSSLNFLRIVRLRRPVTDQKILDLLEDCKSQMGIRTILGVVATDKVKCPALFGFVRPRLLLPEGMIEALSEQELRYVFLHELAHLKRHDIYIGWLITLLQVMHWFNPLVWLAFYRMRSDRELACDALVLARTQSDEPKSYGRIIVNLVERFSRPQRLPGMAGILETKAQLKRRVTMIARFKKNSYQWSPLGVILIIMLGCVSLPDAKHTKASETATSKPAHKPNFRKIKIASKPKNGVLSPDGNKLAFISEGAVWVVPIHGKVDPDIAGEPVRLAEVPEIWDNGSLMAWSADGQWIAVNAWPDEQDTVYVIPVAGGEPRVVQIPARGGHAWSHRLSLSPDGQILAFSAIELGTRHEVSETIDRYIYTISTAGGKPKQVSSGWGRLPSFSPDGKFIAYVSYRKRKDSTENGEGWRYDGDLWIAPSGGGTPIKLNTVEGRLRGPVWSPDGRYIAAHHEPGGTNNSKEIWVFPLSPDTTSAGEPEKIILPNNSGKMLAGWTPEGQLGVFLASKSHWAGYTVPASGGKAVQVTPELNYPYYPRWSRDGERIFLRYVRRDEAPSVRMGYVPADGGALVEIPWSEQPFMSRVPGGGHNVSPDGKRIVISAGQVPYDSKKGLDVWTIPLDGGLPTRLTNGRTFEGYPCWSPDGEQIAFTKNEESFKAIYTVPAGGGQVRQVSSESDSVWGGAIAFSLDGKRIAFFSDGSIKTIPVEGGKPEVLVAEVKSGHHSQLAYSPKGSKIAHNAGDKIWITSLDEGKPEELRTGLPENAKFSGFGWSPDGEKIAFIASIGGEAEFYLIEDFLPESTVGK